MKIKPNLIISKNNLSGDPKNVPASHENIPTAQKEPCIWKQHNKTNNFFMGLEPYFGTPDMI